MKNLGLIFLFTLLFSKFLFGQIQTFDIFVSGAGSNNIVSYDSDGENEKVFIPTQPGNILWPQDILFLDNDEILVSGLNSKQVSRFDKDGNFQNIFMNTQGNGGPTRIKVGPDQLIYILQWGFQGTNLPVVRYDMEGNFIDQFTTPLNTSIGMDWDQDGNFYVSSWSQSKIEKFDSDGNFIETFITNGLAGPTNIWFDNTGKLWVINYNIGTVTIFDSEGNKESDIIQGLSAPEGIAFYPNGDFLIGNGNTNSIKKYNQDGNFIEEIFSSNGLLTTPNAIALRESNVSSNTEQLKWEDSLVFTPLGDNTYHITSYDSGNKTIRIINHLGLTLEVQHFTERFTWDGDQLLPGIYYIQVELQKGLVKTKSIPIIH